MNILCLFQNILAIGQIIQIVGTTTNVGQESTNDIFLNGDQMAAIIKKITTKFKSFLYSLNIQNEGSVKALHMGC